MSNKVSIAPYMVAGKAVSQMVSGLRGIGIILVASLLVAVCAHVALPLAFTPVPLTLQPFAVLIIGMALSPRLAAGSLVAYLLEGAAGLPVFTPGSISTTGIEHLLGPTGGYLLAYPFAAFIIAKLWRSSSRTLTWALLSAAAGNFIILATGAVWMSVYTHASMQAVLAEAVTPFLPGDGLKVAVAAALGFEWYRVRPARRPSDTN
jgi:biotin transport system substrate-specific component